MHIYLLPVSSSLKYVPMKSNSTFNSSYISQPLDRLFVLFWPFVTIITDGIAIIKRFTEQQLQGLGLVGCGQPSRQEVMAVETHGLLSLSLSLVLSIAGHERISYCVIPCLSQTSQQKKLSSHQRVLQRCIQNVTLFLLFREYEYYMKSHAPRWLFLVFCLRRIAFLQDTLVTVVHAREVKDSLIQQIAGLVVYVLFISWGTWSKAGFICCPVSET